MIRRFALAALMLVAAAGCVGPKISTGDVKGPFTWGGVDNVTQLRHLWFSGQPDQAALERGRAEGIDVVINLRDPAEYEWDEKSAVEALGMTYYNVPIRGPEPFDPAAFEQVEALVSQHHGERVLLHCSSSNRAGAWLATHLARKHGTPVEEALAIGRQTGITKDGIEAKVRRYLGAPSDNSNRDRHGPADVERYIERLQREERVRELDPEGVILALAIAPTSVVADIGVGPGVFALPLARHLSQGLVYAVDVEPRQLDALREHLSADGVDNVVPVLASYSDPHLPPRGIDWIFVVDTYHHLEERVAYFQGLRADLTPGGKLVILEYKPGELPVGPPAKHKLSHEKRFGELREAGFQMSERFETHQYHDFEVWRPTSTAP